MVAEYYKLPLKLAQVSRKKEPLKCSLYESVADHIHLISITSFGECKHDETFGCEIWEHDFENIANTQLFKEQLKNAIIKTIEKHEPRLTNIRIDILLDQVDYRLTQRRAKSRIVLKVSGTLAMTNEPFNHSEQFFIGPLSYF